MPLLQVKAKPRGTSTQPQNLVLVQLGAFGSSVHFSLNVRLCQTEVVPKRKEPVPPAGDGFFRQFPKDLLRHIGGVLGTGTGTVHELPIHRQRRIIRVQRCQQVIVSGGDLPHKVNVGGVDLVNVHAAELRTEDVFPLVLVVIAQHIDQLALKLDVGQLVVPVAVAAVDGVPVQVEDPVFLLNDVLLGNAGGLGSGGCYLLR